MEIRSIQSLRSTELGQNLRPAQPFVKWAGGKRSVLKALIDHLPEEGLQRYHEPFVGGGALFFALHQRVSNASLADMNIELMITYKTIQTHPLEILERLKIHQEKHDRQHFLAVRKDYPPEESVDLAAQFIYLNRTCYNGLYRVNKKGRFNVPIGSYKNPIIADEDNIQSVSFALQGVTLRWQSFEYMAPIPGDFIYCDPPYDGTYDQYTPVRFDSGEQVNLEKHAREWSKSGANVMLSNSNTPFIRNLYQRSPWRIHEVSAPRVINSKAEDRKPVTELIITSYDA